MTNATDIHRGSEASRLQKAIDGAPEGLSIVAVSGPGGVGKTFLVNHVLEAMQPSQLGYLQLGTNAANPETRQKLATSSRARQARSLPDQGSAQALSTASPSQASDIWAVLRRKPQSRQARIAARTRPWGPVVCGMAFDTRTPRFPST